MSHDVGECWECGWGLLEAVGVMREAQMGEEMEGLLGMGLQENVEEMVQVGATAGSKEIIKVGERILSVIHDMMKR